MTKSIRKIGGVAIASQKKVMGVERGSIEKVSGVKSTYGTFAFTIETAGADTFTLPLGTSSTYKFDMIVSWGDGEADSTITAYDDADRTHSYTEAGTYTVTLKGKCEYFAFNAAGDITLMKTLTSFSEDIGLRTLNFKGCSNLTTLCSLGKLESLINGESLFCNCSSITTIPENLLDGCTAMTNFRYSFRYCTSLEAIPAGLLEYNVSIYLLTSIFLGCSDAALTTIPADLFRYNTSVITFEDAFYKCNKVTAIPNGIFDYNTNATSVYRCFRGCVGLVNALDGTMFENCEISTFGSTFYGCSGLTGNEWGDGNTPDETPDTIIYNAEHQSTPPSVIDGCFQSCSSLTNAGSIPLAWR